MLSEGSMYLRTHDRHGVVWIDLNLSGAGSDHRGPAEFCCASLTAQNSCPSAWRCDDALA